MLSKKLILTNTNNITNNNNMEISTTTMNTLENEYYVGDVIYAAIKNGLQARGVIIKEGRFIDIGTPEDLKQGISFFK